MGCASTRSSLEETTISSSTVETGFEKSTVEVIVSTIRARSTARLVVPSQFESIKKRLGLNAAEADQATLTGFYQRFGNHDPEAKGRLAQVSPGLAHNLHEKALIYDERQLLAIGILLSRSGASEKARALFELYDEGFLGVLDSAAVGELFGQVFDLAINHLPTLVRPAGNTDEVKKYLARAQQFLKNAVTASVTLVNKPDSKVSLDEFVSQVALYKAGILTNPAGLRQFASDQGPHQDKLATPRKPAADTGPKLSSEPAKPT